MTTDSRQRIIGLNDGLPLAGDHDELVLYDEMDTAMRYFDLPQDEGEYARGRVLCREAIMADWRRGVRKKAAR